MASTHMCSQPPATLQRTHNPCDARTSSQGWHPVVRARPSTDTVSQGVSQGEFESPWLGGQLILCWVVFQDSAVVILSGRHLLRVLRYPTWCRNQLASLVCLREAQLNMTT